MTGEASESFTKIPAFCELLKVSDPSATVYWQADEDFRFQRIFIAPGSCKHAFRYCRPLVGLECTQSKSVLPSTILLATCHDGENHIIILAWAVVRTENAASWEWFLTHLDAAYPLMRRVECVFISDTDKGLIKAVSVIFPMAHYSYFGQHLVVNMRAESDKDVVALLRQVSDDFPVPKYGHTILNEVEAINSAFQPASEMVVLRLCNALWIHIMVTRSARATEATEMSDGDLTLTRYANGKFETTVEKSRAVVVHQFDSTSAVMIEKGVPYSYSYSVKDRQCECGEWREMSLSCIHVIRFTGLINEDARTYGSEFWMASSFKETYKVPVPPVSIHELALSDLCRAPLLEKDEEERPE